MGANMNPRTRYLIAFCELLIVVGVLVYFFFPRTLDGALGGSFDREKVTTVEALITPYGNGETRLVTLTPGTESYQGFLDLLDSRRYSPYYIDTDSRDVALDAKAEVTFVQAEGSYTFSITGDQAIDFSGTDSRARTFRTRGGVPFQEDILAYLLLLDYEEVG